MGENDLKISRRNGKLVLKTHLATLVLPADRWEDLVKAIKEVAQ